MRACAVIMSIRVTRGKPLLTSNNAVGLLHPAGVLLLLLLLMSLPVLLLKEETIGDAVTGVDEAESS